MNLHDDNEAFSELIEAAAESIGLPQVYVEKDYWVTKALKYLSGSPHIEEAVFKGGTSLSKAYRLIDRFSEDIDLAVFAGELSNNGIKKLLKNVESIVATGLKCLEDDPRLSKGGKYRKTVYQYPRQVNGHNFGQASPELLVEVNAFTHPEPFEAVELQSLIAEALLKLGKADLIEQFGLESFTINVLSVRRTLVEKILGMIKDSYNEEPTERLSVRIRHLYDICLIMREDDIQSFLSTDEFKAMFDTCIEDEKAGFFDYSDCLEKPLADAPLFSEFENWKPSLETTYNGVFSDLVYGDLPQMEEIAEKLGVLHKSLDQIR